MKKELTKYDYFLVALKKGFKVVPVPYLGGKCRIDVIKHNKLIETGKEFFYSKKSKTTGVNQLTLSEAIYEAYKRICETHKLITNSKNQTHGNA